MPCPSAKSVARGLFEYYTPKIVLIRNLKIGIFNRLVQLTILGYIIGYAVVWNKGYQDFSTIESAVTTKVKGVTFTDFPKDEFDPRVQNIELYQRIWDVPDFIIPPSENNAFFVTTNIVITANQTQDDCPEDPKVPGIVCHSNGDCTEGLPMLTGNGVQTGRCVESDMESKKKVCEIRGWCPVERDINPLLNNTALLSATKKFTVLIKNFVEFPKFGIKRRNIPDYRDADYLNNCHYNPVNDSLCPIFVLGDIVPDNYDKMSLKGGVIAIVINWECNFDFKASDCFPTYTFRRLDDENSPISPGLNFRYAHYYGDSQRTLYKAYGIKFIVLSQGRGGKFSVVPLLLNLGSGLGLLAVATVICDLLVLYCVEKREIYKSNKFQSVTDDSSGCFNPQNSTSEYDKSHLVNIAHNII